MGPLALMGGFFILLGIVVLVLERMFGSGSSGEMHVKEGHVKGPAWFLLMGGAFLILIDAYVVSPQ